MRIRPAVALLAAAAALAGARWALALHERARRLAAAAPADPPSSPSPAAALEELPSLAPEEIARVGARVTALLEASDGSLLVGTSGAGIVRFPPPQDADLGGGPPGAREGSTIAGLSGRELLVNALAERDGLAWAATQGGLVALDGERRAASLLDGEAVDALAVAGRSLFAGTARGIFRVSADRGAEPLAASGPSGEPLRVTALAASGGLLWIGTASGAYSLPVAAAEAPLTSRTARWHPLVFGDPPADTNAVTALAPLEGGALAGTDDGGVVRLREGGRAAASRFPDAPANAVCPGAAAPAGNGAAAVGTQGGLLLARPAGKGLAVGRPAGLPRGEVSAVAVGRDGILLGTADGAVLRIRRPAADAG